MEHKNVTGKTPVLDVGALSKIKSGKIKVNKIDPLLIPFVFFFFWCVLCPRVIYCYTFRLQLILFRVSGNGRCEGDNKKWSQIYGWSRKGVRLYNPSNWVQKQCAFLAEGKHELAVELF